MSCDGTLGDHTDAVVVLIAFLVDAVPVDCRPLRPLQLVVHVDNDHIVMTHLYTRNTVCHSSVLPIKVYRILPGTHVPLGHQLQILTSHVVMTNLYTRNRVCLLSVLPSKVSTIYGIIPGTHVPLGDQIQILTPPVYSRR